MSGFDRSDHGLASIFDRQHDIIDVIRADRSRGLTQILSDDGKMLWAIQAVVTKSRLEANLEMTTRCHCCDQNRQIRSCGFNKQILKRWYFISDVASRSISRHLTIILSNDGDVLCAFWAFVTDPVA